MLVRSQAREMAKRMPRKPRERSPTMQAIARRHGLVSELSRRIGIKPSSIWTWKLVPKKHIRKVARCTGIPVAVLRAEHPKRFLSWKIPVAEVQASPEGQPIVHPQDADTLQEPNSHKQSRTELLRVIQG